MRWKRLAALPLAAALMAGPVHASDDLDRALAAIEAYDYPRALVPLRAAAAQGDHRAQRLLGFVLLHGEQLFRGVEADTSEALAWLRKASAAGDEQAAVALARIEHRLLARSAKSDTTPRRTP